jgi:hypothetical protein
MSRLTALGWLAVYDYNDAAPTALRLGAGTRPQGHTALSCSTFLKSPMKKRAQ